MKLDHTRADHGSLQQITCPRTLGLPASSSHKYLQTLLLGRQAIHLFSHLHISPHNHLVNILSITQLTVSVTILFRSRRNRLSNNPSDEAAPTTADSPQAPGPVPSPTPPSPLPHGVVLHFLSAPLSLRTSHQDLAKAGGQREMEKEGKGGGGWARKPMST